MTMQVPYLGGELDVVAHDPLVDRDAVDGPDPARQVPVDDGAELAVPEADRVLEAIV